MLLHAWAPRGKDTLAILVVKELARIFRFLQVSFVGPGLFSSAHGVSDILVCTDDFHNSREIVSHYLRKSKKSLAVIIPRISETGEIHVLLFKTVYHPIQRSRVFVEITELGLEALHSSELYSFFRTPTLFEELIINLLEDTKSMKKNKEAPAPSKISATDPPEQPEQAGPVSEKALDEKKKAPRTRVPNTK